MKVFSYGSQQYPFASIVSSALECDDLSEIHTRKDYPLLTKETNQKTVFHQSFYAIGEPFLEVYRQFIRSEIMPLFKEDVVYQKVPTFRVHLPNNLAVGRFHRDREFGHQAAETNLWLPLTKAWDTSSIWIESEEGKKDFQPVSLDYGQVLMFNGANLEHGNKLNETGKTRVSIDFRVLPYSTYQAVDKRSAGANLRFVIGGYYELMPRKISE